MDQNALKKQVAEAALRYVPEGEVVGVGTGSTANFSKHLLSRCY